jgi:hypothetical protein
MMITEARVETERPSRYLVQLCSHLSNQGGHLTGRVRGHLGSRSHGRPEGPVQVEWTESAGSISLDWGRCALRADPGALVLRAEATDAENLGRIQELMATHLARFARREPLTVTWQTR